MGEGDTLLNALVGAVVTVLLSFVPLSPVIGGGVAGYLQRESRRDGLLVGAVSGLLSAVAFVVLTVLTFGAFLGLLPMMGDAGWYVGWHWGPGDVGPMGPRSGLAVGVLLLFGVGFALVYGIGLSAVGGYLGSYLAEERRR